MVRFAIFVLATLVALAFHGSAEAQLEVQSGSEADIRFGSPAPRATCSDHVLAYGREKATGLEILNLNTTNSILAGGQWFEAPAPIEITGARFYAYVEAVGEQIDTTVAIYASDDVDRLPLDSPLATVTTTISNGIGTLDELRQTVSFSSPLIVEGPFVMTVENPSPSGLQVVTNSWVVADGAGEFLASVNLGGTWYSGSEVNVGSIPLDADWLLEPIVQFELVPEVSATPKCLIESTTVALAASSPFLESRFFNRAAFLQLNEQSYSWDFGDGSPTALGAEQLHKYQFIEGTVYEPILTATLFPLGGEVCLEAATTSVSALPSCQFIFSDRFE